MFRVSLPREAIEGLAALGLACITGAIVVSNGTGTAIMWVALVLAAIAAVITRPLFLLLGAIIALPTVVFTDLPALHMPINLVASDLVLIAYSLSALMHPLPPSVLEDRASVRRSVAVAGVFAVFFLIVGLVSSVNAGFSLEAVRKLGRVGLVLLAAWVTPRALRRDEAVLACKALIVVAVISAVGGLLEGVLAMAGVKTSIFQFVGLIPRISGGFGDPNFYGFFLALVIPVALARILLASSVRGRTIVGFGLLVVAAIGTLSRGAAIGIAAGVVVVVVETMVVGKHRRVSRAGRVLSITGIVVALAAVVAVSVPGIWPIVTERFAEGLTSGPTDPTGVLRLRVWENSLELLRQHPLLGVGPGNFLNTLVETGSDTPFYAHNSLLETAVETGWVGEGMMLGASLAVLVAALGTSGGLLSAAVSSGDSDGDVWVAVGLAGGLVGGFASSFFVSNALYLASTACVVILMSNYWAARRQPGLRRAGSSSHGLE